MKKKITFALYSGLVLCVMLLRKKEQKTIDYIIKAENLRDELERKILEKTQEKNG